MTRDWILGLIVATAVVLIVLAWRSQARAGNAGAVSLAWGSVLLLLAFSIVRMFAGWAVEGWIFAAQLALYVLVIGAMLNLVRVRRTQRSGGG